MVVLSTCVEAVVEVEISMVDEVSPVVEVTTLVDGGPRDVVEAVVAVVVSVTV